MSKKTKRRRISSGVVFVRIVLNEDKSRQTSAVQRFSDGLWMKNLLRQINLNILPEILIKELDEYLFFYAESMKKRTFDLQDQMVKISLPSQILVELHSNWIDLIRNTNYNLQVKSIRTKEFRRHLSFFTHREENTISLSFFPLRKNFIEIRREENKNDFKTRKFD